MKQNALEKRCHITYKNIYHTRFSYTYTLSKIRICDLINKNGYMFEGKEKIINFIQLFYISLKRAKNISRKIRRLKKFIIHKTQDWWRLVNLLSRRLETLIFLGGNSIRHILHSSVKKFYSDFLERRIFSQ